ncbi:unnamed protein product [Diamesa hyperborea]
MDELAIKVTPSMPENFKVPSGAMGPTEKDALAQLSNSHPLQQSEAQYAQHRMNLNTNLLRNVSGLGGQLRYLMEINSVNKVGRLPFLPSSNASRDVLLGLDELIEASDVFGTSEFSERVSQPHAVMEKHFGIL